THVGSLPRPQAVLELLLKQERGEPFDRAALDAEVARAVDDAVARQVELGLDVVSDGETAKIGYATYVKDRLSGFAGHHPRPPHLDLAPHPEFREAMARMIGPQRFRRAACVGPIEVVDRTALEKDLENLRAAVERHRPAEVFMNAASPGVISAFQQNRFYPSHEAYVEAIAAAMREEYEAIVAAGFLLQLDCPDLAAARRTHAGPRAGSTRGGAGAAQRRWAADREEGSSGDGGGRGPRAALGRGAGWGLAGAHRRAARGGAACRRECPPHARGGAA